MSDDFKEIFVDDSVTVTQLDGIPTQELITIPVEPTVRFENVRAESDDSIEKRKYERVPEKSRKQSCWALAVYTEWAKWRHAQAETVLGDNGLVPENLQLQSAITLDYWLSRFVIEARRKDGNPYPPNTLYNITASLQRMFRESYGRHDVNLLDSKDSTFAEFRKALDSRMKELTTQGNVICLLLFINLFCFIFHKIPKTSINR